MKMTLGELRDAYSSGSLTEPLMLDNDWVGVSDVYESDPHLLLRDALELLGIPYENV